MLGNWFSLFYFRIAPLPATGHKARRQNRFMTRVLKIATASALGNAFGNEPADKRMEILRLVGECGSISQAARDAGVSYKAAWQAIDTLTNLAGVVLVERAVGGSGGGGASITLAGQKLLSMADLLCEARKQVFSSFRYSKLLLPPADPVLSGMGIRTSMRNQMPCTVEKLETRGQVVRVHLQLAEGATVVSRITKASAELLGLKKHQQVLALCKANAVSVVADPAPLKGNPATVQVLGGRADRISRGGAGHEVSVQLDAGLQLVGFAAIGSALKAGTRVCILVDEAAIVIALAG